MAILRPGPALAPFVELIWYSDDRVVEFESSRRERVLPTGLASLVVRLSDEPVRVFAGLGDERADTHGHAVVGGARSSFYVRDTSRPSIALGVQFRPGGATALLGVPGAELAERHTPLEALWGRAAREWREQLLCAPSAKERLACFEAKLTARVAQATAIHPSVVAALRALGDCRGPAAVDEAWRASGYSRRHFIALFRREVGLPPKIFARIQRFQAVLRRTTRQERSNWAHAAAAVGLADQSHLVREFQAFAGLAPTRYRPYAGRPNHVPVLASSLR